MKRIFTYFRMLAAVLLAGAALFACTMTDVLADETDQPDNGPKVYSITIKAGNARTKALTFNGSSEDPTNALKATWADGDELTIYNSTKGKPFTGTLAASNVSVDGLTATFSGTVSGVVDEGDELELRYHYHEFAEYSGQDGTLASAAGYDCATATMHVGSIDDSKKITFTEGSATFETQTAIVKLSLKEGSTPLSATTLTLSASVVLDPESPATSVQLYSYTIPSDTYSTDGNGAGILYFALPGQDAVESYFQSIFNTSVDIQSIWYKFSTVKDDVTLSCDKYGYPFVTGHYYRAELAMTPPYYAAKSDDIGKIIATDGNIYATLSDIPEGKEVVGMIAYVGALPLGDASGCAHGLAIGKKMVARLHWEHACELATMNTPTILGGVWRLPSKDDMENMFQAFDGAGKFKEKYCLVYSEDTSAFYNYSWTSTKNNRNYYQYKIQNNDVSFHEEVNDLSRKAYIYPVLAF